MFDIQGLSEEGEGGARIAEIYDIDSPDMQENDATFTQKMPVIESFLDKDTRLF